MSSRERTELLHGNGSHANPVVCVEDSRRCRHRRNEQVNFDVSYAES